MNNFAEKLKNKIQKDEIVQIPLWVFWSKAFLVFLFFILSLSVGAFAFSLTLDSVLALGFEGVNNKFCEFFNSIPLLWFLFFSIFSAFAIVGMKHFPKAYKINSIFLIVINIVLSLIIGIIFYFLHIPEKFTYFNNNMEHRIEKKWNNPTEGLLFGKIITPLFSENDGENYIKIQTKNNKIWTVKIKDKTFLQHIKYKKNNFDEKRNYQKIVKIKGYISENLAEDNKIFIANKIMRLKGNRFKILTD